MHSPGLAAAPARGVHARHKIPVAVVIANLFLDIFSAASKASFVAFLPPSAPITFNTYCPSYIPGFTRYIFQVRTNFTWPNYILILFTT